MGFVLGTRRLFSPHWSGAIPIYVDATLQSSVFVPCPFLLSSTSPASLNNLRDGQLDICSRSLEIGRNVEKTWSLEPASITLESRQDLNTNRILPHSLQLGETVNISSKCTGQKASF